MQSKKIKKLIIANSLLLVFLVAGFVYAWFASNFGSTVDGDEVEVIADSALEISFDGQTWKNYLNLTDSNSDIDWTKLEFKDITGSGNGHFLRPALTQFDSYAQVDPSGEWNDPIVNEDYIKFDLYLRSTDQLNVYLGDGSTVQPLAQKLIGPYTTSEADANHKSSYGDFSKDLVAGAVRVSAVDASSSHLFTWIPRPNIYLAAGPSAPITSYDISTSAASGGTFVGVSPYKHYYYASATETEDMTQYGDNAGENLITGDITKSIVDLNKDKYKLASLTTPKGTYYQEKVTVYIWLEGCDNEARRAFVGGKFRVSLGLTAEDVI